MPLAPNQQLYEYRIVRRLGQGGFGTVYLAHDTLLDRPVAIKELTITRQTDEQAFKRFLQEARTAGGLNHPNIVTVYALKVEGSNVYLAMEYVGGSLRGLLEKHGKLDIEQAVKIAIDVCEGLAAVHAKGIVHRDIKPENILLTEDSRAKVSDFGIAHVPRSAGETSLTQGGFQPGTLVYMSPEQVLGKPVDARSDVYQVGELLHEMLAGRHYIDLAEIERQARESTGNNSLRMQAKVFDLLADAVCVKPPVPLKSLRPEIPDQLAATVEAALAKNPAQRPLDGIVLSHQLAGQPSERSVPPRNKMALRLTPPPVPSATSRSQVSVSPHNGMVLTLAPGVEMIFVRIPAGEFLMGSSNADEEAFDHEKPQHKVQLDEYWMGKYPVTVAQFAAFVKATGYKTPGSTDVGQKAYPVVKVSWYDATAFCQWASQATGREVRLPTEAEWEKAARGTDGRLWPWGNEPPDETRCNYELNVGGTTLVGQYSPRGDSPYGCVDMAGNVREWTSSLYRPYPYKPDDREDPDAEGERTVRGGLWHGDRCLTRCANRYWGAPADSDDDIGFRLVSPGSRTSFGKPASLPTASGAARPLPMTPTPLPPVPSATSRSRVSAPPHNEMVLRLTSGVEMIFVRVPAGEFLMGSNNADKKAPDDEKPQHKVQLDEYWMGKYPVTVAQFAAFVKATGYKTPRKTDLWPKAYPVVNVRWYDAIAFCQWASQATGREVRLTTEAEWEKAARGTDGRIWPWGNEPPDETRCNFDDNVKGTTPVGQYSPRGDSPYGCADMAGNVFEWMSSLYRPYPYKPDDREDTDAEGKRAVRGGSAYNNRFDIRCATRFRNVPDYCFYNLGFRLVSPGSISGF